MLSRRRVDQVKKSSQAGQLSEHTPVLMTEAVRLALTGYGKEKLQEVYATSEFTELIKPFPPTLFDTRLDNEQARRLNAFVGVLKEIPTREGEEHSVAWLFLNFIPLLEQEMTEEKERERVWWR